MRKAIIIFSFAGLIAACTNNHPVKVCDKQKIEADSVLNRWHVAASEADFETYFEILAEDGYFLGTDSSEVWDKPTFMDFSKPHFETAPAWDFTPLRRNWFCAETGDLLWFEETLDTWMGPCRGSGVMVAKEGQWKLKQYNLSILVPNDQVPAYLKLIAPAF